MVTGFIRIVTEHTVSSCISFHSSKDVLLRCSYWRMCFCCDVELGVSALLCFGMQAVLKFQSPCSEGVGVGVSLLWRSV